ncbi:MAG: hypothetical protein NTW19_21540 [Planctomycetota bacterium]|nr:hypothetical protein [Planctomycetota bacterium]
MAGIVGASMLILGCPSHPSKTSATSDHFVNAPQGYLRLRGVEPKDIRFVVDQLAESKRWQRTTNTEGGSYSPATQDDFVRHTDVFRDSNGHDIRIEWVWEKGHDALVLISADSSIQEFVSTAVGVNVLRRQQGMPPLVY